MRVYLTEAQPKLETLKPDKTTNLNFRHVSEETFA